MHSYRSALFILMATALWSSLSIGSLTARAQNDLAFEPYSVYVAQQDSHARCGPSGEYYRTDPLRHGQELEVYAETDNGWLGIRPPDGSFCWIPAETVELGDSQENGVVVEDKTPAWIGTHLGRARSYRWLVQLAKGEPVTVVGRSEREGPDGPQLWYRIVPPSGEYRWVHRSQVVDSSEALVASIQHNVPGREIVVFQDGPTRARKSTDAVSPRDESVTKSSVTKTSATKTSATELSAANRSSRRNRPRKALAETSGRSVLRSDQAIGSGLRKLPATEESPRRTSSEAQSSVAETDSVGPRLSQSSPTNVTDAMKKGGLLASVEFLSRPRLLEIGSAPAAPTAGETASDGNWVAGTSRKRTAPTSGSPATFATPASQSAVAEVSTTLSAPQPANPIMQVSGQQPMPAQTLTPAAAMPAMKSMTFVSSERIAQIEAETRDATVDQLSLVFSRLIAVQATTAETEPVQRAAQRLATTSGDAVLAGRARLLAERAEQYCRIADRRDGRSVVRRGGSLSLPRSTTASTADIQTATYTETREQTPSETGYLVQVYSARANSPPFALTDDAGRTIAYVTPAPGVNLRTHLNSKITVSGRPGYLTGLNTPHIMVDQAIRTPE